MLRFGLYSAAVTLLGLAQMHLEKLLLAQAMTASAVGWYGVSFTLSRLPAIIPGASGQALLPAMSRLQALSDPRPLARLYYRSLWTLGRVLAPLALLTALAGPPFLTFWAGPEYGRHSTPALQILLAGCVVDGISYAPRILLAAMGVPDRILRIQAPVLPLYFGTAWYLVGRWGIAGAAAAWTLRASAEALLAHLLAVRELRARRRETAPCPARNPE
jgi:O-antigen/teichoic acid export membrane protein